MRNFMEPSYIREYCSQCGQDYIGDGGFVKHIRIATENGDEWVTVCSDGDCESVLVSNRNLIPVPIYSHAHRKGYHYNE